MDPTDPPVVVEPPTRAAAAVIWLHGLGADGHDFAPLVPHLAVRRHARFVFPHAPPIPVSINGGLVMRAWYDIVERDGQLVSEEGGLQRARDRLEGLIEEEHGQGLAYDRIVVAGFSQGGAVALHTALRFPRRLAGLAGLSTYLPLADTLATQCAPQNAAIPILMAHGLHDPVLELARAEDARRRLVDLGYRVEWHAYPMEHAVSPAEIADLDAWLSRVIPG